MAREEFFSPIVLITAPPADSAIRLEQVDSPLSVAITASNLATWILGAAGVTQKQIRAWAAANGSPLYIYTIDAAVSADTANNVNIEWLHGNSMSIGDDLYNFIQSTLGFSSAQMSAAYATMQALPL